MSESHNSYTEPEPKGLRGFALEGEDQPIKEGEQYVAWY